MLNLLPLAPFGRFRDIRVLGAVNNHIFRHDSPLDHTLLRVLASTTKQTGRLSSEITDLFSMTVNLAESKFFNDSLVGFLLRLLLLLGSILTLFAQLLEMLVNFRKVTVLQVPDNLTLLLRHDLPPVLEEVLVEHVLGGVVVVQHLPVEGGGLLRVALQ